VPPTELYTLSEGNKAFLRRVKWKYAKNVGLFTMGTYFVIHAGWLIIRDINLIYHLGISQPKNPVG